MHHNIGMKLMKKVNLRFIGLLIFISLFQHFSFATSPSTAELSKPRSGTILNSYLENASVEHHQNQIGLFVEFEEDEVQNEQVYLRATLTSSFIANNYSILMNTLYLRLAFANLNKVELPFFVLYHSWKSDLS
jgi:hypothetical protein